MELKGFMGCFERGIARELNSFGQEHYPSYSLNQNNSAHGVYKFPYRLLSL